MSRRNLSGPIDLVCFSHLRWRWVYQRPQHLLTRAAREFRTFVFEEASYCDGPPHVQRERMANGVTLVRPCVPPDTRKADLNDVLRGLLDDWLVAESVNPGVLWYYTPEALPFSSHLPSQLVVYDCMDELSMFAGARPEIRLLERGLLARADVVFTGGHSLYEAKRQLHHNVHEMPSSVDVAHFARARRLTREPADHADIPHPRIGYCGVLDERLDLGLIAGVADARPDLHQVFVGPVTKIAFESLPQRPNIHYLGARDYDELPACLAAWDVAMLPFALNDATRFISPTKTPEYLAAGCQVVSAPIADVVHMWGNTGLVRIAAGVHDFVAAIDDCLADHDALRLATVDRVLASHSWDATWSRMRELMSQAVARVA